VKTKNLAFGNVATIAILAMTLTTVLVVGASADVYHHPYHRPVHRVMMHHDVHAVNRHVESHDTETRDTEHPHH
jgi:hypothetical protein